MDDAKASDAVTSDRSNGKPKGESRKEYIKRIGLGFFHGDSPPPWSARNAASATGRDQDIMRTAAEAAAAAAAATDAAGRRRSIMTGGGVEPDLTPREKPSSNTEDGWKLSRASAGGTPSEFQKPLVPRASREEMAGKSYQFHGCVSSDDDEDDDEDDDDDDDDDDDEQEYAGKRKGRMTVAADKKDSVFSKSHKTTAGQDCKKL